MRIIVIWSFVRCVVSIDWSTGFAAWAWLERGRAALAAWLGVRDALEAAVELAVVCACTIRTCDSWLWLD